MFFPQRIAEPEEMEEIENKIFEKVARSKYTTWFETLADDIIERTRFEEGSVLDIGSGPGFLVKALSDRLKDSFIYGLDLSDTAIGLARKNCQNNKNTSFTKGSVYKLPFRHGQMDLVVSKDSFHHFSDPIRALKEMFRVLRKGGYLYIQDLRRDTPYRLIKTALPLKTSLQKLQLYSVRSAYTKQEATDLLRKAGILNFTINNRRFSKKKFGRYKQVDKQALRDSLCCRYRVVALKK